uniref:SFRICE_028844 n=2 Tax=Spodoptera frugiperda TaxID=7108 RepID=A0A2H1V841_SPOFR
MSNLPEALKPISWLAGTWSTEEGEGSYPNIPSFQYEEELEFVCIGQPMFNYLSTSKHLEKKTPMHQERGFLRIKPGTNELAFIVSHNMGLTSLEEGKYLEETKQITMETVGLTRMSFSKPPFVKKMKRTFTLLSPDTLEVILYMETDTTPMTQHLKAVYKKVEK